MHDETSGRHSGAMMLSFSLYFLFLLLFGLIIIEAAKTNGSVSVVDEAMSVSAVSTLADYDMYLLDRWGLLAFEQRASNPTRYGSGYASTDAKVNDVFVNTFGNMFNTADMANTSLVAGVAVDNNDVRAKGVGETTLGNANILKASIQEYSKQNLPLMLGKDFDNFYDDADTYAERNEDDPSTTEDESIIPATLIHGVSTDSVVGRSARSLEQEIIASEDDPLQDMIKQADAAIDDALSLINLVEPTRGSTLASTSNAVKNALETYNNELAKLPGLVDKYNSAVDDYNKYNDEYEYLIEVELPAANSIVTEANARINEYKDYSTQASNMLNSAWLLRPEVGLEFSDRSKITVDNVKKLLGDAQSYISNEASVLASQRDYMTDLKNSLDDWYAIHSSDIASVQGKYDDWYSPNLSRYEDYEKECDDLYEYEIDYNKAQSCYSNLNSVIKNNTEALATQQNRWQNKSNMWSTAYSWHSGGERRDETDPTTKSFSYGTGTYAAWPSTYPSSLIKAYKNDTSLVCTLTPASNKELHSYAYLNYIKGRKYENYICSRIGGTISSGVLTGSDLNRAYDNVKGQAKIITDQIAEVEKALNNYFASYKAVREKAGDLWDTYSDELFSGKYVEKKLTSGFTFDTLIITNDSSTQANTPTPSVTLTSGPGTSVELGESGKHPLNGITTFWDEPNSWGDKYTVSSSASNLAKLEISYLQTYARSMQRLVYYLNKLLAAYPIDQAQVDKVTDAFNQKKDGSDPKIANQKSYDGSGTTSIDLGLDYYEKFDLTKAYTTTYFNSKKDADWLDSTAHSSTDYKHFIPMGKYLEGDLTSDDTKNYVDAKKFGAALGNNPIKRQEQFISDYEVKLYSIAWVIPTGNNGGTEMSSGSPQIHNGGYNNYNSPINIHTYIQAMMSKLFYNREDDIYNGGDDSNVGGLKGFARVTVGLLNPSTSDATHVYNVGDTGLSACINDKFYTDNIAIAYNDDGDPVHMSFSSESGVGTEKMVENFVGTTSIDSTLRNFDSNVHLSINRTRGKWSLVDALTEVQNTYEEDKSCGALVKAMHGLYDKYSKDITEYSTSSGSSTTISDLEVEDMKQYWLGDRLIIAGYGAYSTSNRLNYGERTDGTKGIVGSTLSGYDLSTAELPTLTSVQVNELNGYDKMQTLAEVFENSGSADDPESAKDHNPRTTAVDPSTGDPRPDYSDYTFAGAELEYLIHGSRDEWANQYYTYMLMLQMGMLRSADAVAYDGGIRTHAEHMSFAYPLYMVTNMLELGIRDANDLCAGHPVDPWRESCPSVVDDGVMQEETSPGVYENLSLFPSSDGVVDQDASYDRDAKSLLYRDHCMMALLAFVPRETIAQRVGNLVQMETFNYYFTKNHSGADPTSVTDLFQLAEAYTFIEASAKMQVHLMTPVGWDLARGLADSSWLTYDRVVYRGY